MVKTTMIKNLDVIQSKKITTHFFDMCPTSDNDCGKAKTLFTAIENKSDESSLPWNNSVRVNVDKTNTMTNRYNSEPSNTLIKNPYVAWHTDDSLSEVLDLNIENLCIDLCYCFDKSSERKGKLAEYFALWVFWWRV